MSCAPTCYYGFMADVDYAAVRSSVEELLGGDTSGHDFGHIQRVHALAMQFTDESENKGLDRDVIELASYLHDVDDYKLVGHEQSAKLGNARRIMEEAHVLADTADRVLSIITTMGYSKSLRGIRPDTPEGMIVSDADMCDAIGANGTVRCMQYALSDKGSGRIFSPDIYPHIAITAEAYNSTGTTHDTDSMVNHHFEKLFTLRGLMLTEPGKREAAKRHAVMWQFIKAFLEEQQAPARWHTLIEQFK